MTLEQEIQDCSDCRIYTETEPSHNDATIWTLRNGMSLSLGRNLASVPLWSDFVLCPKHEIRATEEWVT